MVQNLKKKKKKIQPLLHLPPRKLKKTIKGQLDFDHKDHSTKLVKVKSSPKMEKL